MTLHDFYELNEYWRSHPPTHLLIAAYLPIGKSKPEPKGGLGELLAMMGANGEIRG